MKQPLYPEKLQGKYVNLRIVKEDDAEFTLQLRLNPKKSQYFLNKIDNDVEKQRSWIKKVLEKEDEYFFIIEDKAGNPLGTCSVYNIKSDTSTGGRWCMKDGVSPEAVLEGDILLKSYIFETLKHQSNFFDVIKNNKQVLRYHRSWGAEQIGEDENEIFFVMKKDVFERNKDNFLRML